MKIAWIDVETTGLDYDADFLLEVACIITDEQGKVLSEPFHKVVYYTEPMVKILRERSVEVVQEMHDKTGLWDRLPLGDSLFVIEDGLLDLLKSHSTEPGQLQIGGNSLELDKMFLRKTMRSVYDWLHYRTTDVSVIQQFMERAGYKIHRVDNFDEHNALSDIKVAVAYYRSMLDQVRRERPRVKGADLRTPEEWQVETGIRILDPDGWDRSNFEEDWARRITRSEFQAKADVSTVRSL